MCTTCRHSFASFEAKLGNPSPTCFMMKQATECQRVSSHHLHPLIGFEAQSDKPPPTWFWDPNQETIIVILRPKSSNHRPWFCGTNQETIAVVLRPNHWQAIPIGFEAKLENLCFSSPPRVRCASHTASLDFLIIRPLSTRLVPYHPRSSTPSFLPLPRSSSLPTKSHSPPTHHWIYVSSTEMRWIQIQTRTSQLLITHINQSTNHLVSQSLPWWVHWQL
jgi:hypothetical protein